MKSSARIRMDFDKAKREAKKLDNIAEKLKKQANDNLESSMRNLSSAWMGNNSQSFLKKEGTIKANMLKTARDLQGIASDIRDIAQRIYEAEMQAYEIAKRRSKK